MKNGKLIVLEGGEGCGKTTVSKELSLWMKDNNIDHILSREPGGTPIGEHIRNIIYGKEYSDNIDPFTELLLFEAARREHYVNVIKPALESGKHVILDRFTLTTEVYQGKDSNDYFDPTNMLIHNLNLKSTDNYKPDCTILLDLDPEISMKRVNNDSRDLNRRDLVPIEEYTRIRKLYLSKIKFINSSYIVDASQIVKDVTNDVIKIVKGVIK